MSLTGKKELDGQGKNWFPFRFKKRKPVYLIRCPECGREFEVSPKKLDWSLIKLRCRCGVVFFILRSNGFLHNSKREEVKIFYKGKKYEN